MKHRASALVAALSLIAGSVLWASPASAASASFHKSCFGHQGTFKTGSHVLRVDWNGDGVLDECFGVAPSRTIWHIWAGSSGWREMPGHGRADDMLGTFISRGGYDFVVVYVASPHSHLYSLGLAFDWAGWFYCETNQC